MIDHLFRHESGRMVSLLTRIFGVQNMDLAEDVMQDTLLKAVQQWPYSGIPQNPSAWLFKVAKNNALDIIRREKFQIHYAEDITHLLESEWTVIPTLNDLFLDSEIKDDQLRMIFTCCYPGLPAESQIALTLKTLCGFSVPEIAHAFLTNEATINKRLYRAKQQIREERIRFEIPSGNELADRLNNVLSTLYLLFNEGYSSSHADTLIREDLVDEAIRLTTLLTEHPNTNTPAVHALLALIYLHASRMQSRTDATGDIILLPEQDRSRWNQDFISKGLYHLDRSAGGEKITRYHMEAAIASYHSTAESYEKTDWESILNIYNRLYTEFPSPVIGLNRAIVIAQLYGPEQGIKEIMTLSNAELLEHYYLLPGTLGELYYRMKEYANAIAQIERALELTDSAVEKRFLQKKLEKIHAEAKQHTKEDLHNRMN
ncbi:MAG TPA: sigma-70 family RNA polymerase sigma factor [Candidatus Kapabacteria bacterium]|nr:sigma-70 family RNA polymerase sigma factor [Candidatus Kapabacteria bacterium]